MPNLSCSLRALLSLWLALAIWPALASEPLRLGIYAYRPKPIIEQRYQPLADYLSQALGNRRVQLVPLDQDELEVAVEQNLVDFLMTNPAHLLVVRSSSYLAGVLATVISREDGQDTTSLGGVIVTAAERADLNTLKDLRGKSIGVPGTHYLGGYQTQILELQEAGIAPPADDRMKVLGSHDQVIEAVLAGRVDAGFVRTGIIESLRDEGRLDPVRLKIINPQSLAGFPYRISTRLYPEWPFVALPSVDRQTLRAITVALFTLDAAHPAARAAHIAGFAPAADYAPVEHLARRLRMPPYDLVPQFTLADVWQQYRLQLISGAGALALIVLLLVQLGRRNHALSQLMHSLQEREENLRELNATLETRVAERTAELLTAKDAAEAANRAKSTFLANMSHELRTPMNAIMGLTDSVLRRASDPKQIDQLGKVKAASQHLLRVINDILDLSKIEADRLQLELLDFRLGEILENVASLTGHKVTEKGLRLLIDLEDGLPASCYRGDPLRLAQVLLNLTSNALKFTECGAITLRCRQTADDADGVLLLWEVADTGIGIAAEDQLRLFSAFEQADGSMTRKYGGTGLGLAISKRLVHMMGGEIGVNSEVGQGSTFWFTVHLHKADSTAVPPTPTFSDDTPEDRLRSQFAGTRILLAEDEPINQEVSRGLLEDVGLVVDLADDGEQAVALAQQHPYALILMDIQMPQLNGIEATQAIRVESLNRQTPILAMTANAFDDDRQACLDAGMNDHIAKPVDPARLYQTLLAWLEKQRGD